VSSWYLCVAMTTDEYWQRVSKCTLINIDVRCDVKLCHG